MTSFGLPIAEEKFASILNHYLDSKQLWQAYLILESMPPQILYWTRFLRACVDAKEMEMAEKACVLMEGKVLLPL